MSKSKLTPTRVDFGAQRQPQREHYRLARTLCLYADHRNEVSVSMLHSVDEKGRLGPGQPVDPAEFARSIYRLRKDEMIEKLQLIGPNILAENREAMLWWRPASVDKMWFKTAEPQPRLTALNGVPLPQPALVFRANKGGSGLAVWALAENTRPSAETRLYHAPYMNRSQHDGGICMGRFGDSASEKCRTPQDFERAFFDTNFSHTPPPLIHAKDKSITFAAQHSGDLERYIALLETLRADQERSQKQEGCNARPLWASYLVPGRTLASILQA